MFYNTFDINMASNVSKLAGRLRSMRPTIVLYNLLGVDKKSMSSALCISKELHEYVKDTGFILVTLERLDSTTSPVMTKAARNKFKELMNVEEDMFHPGGNSSYHLASGIPE